MTTVFIDFNLIKIRREERRKKRGSFNANESEQKLLLVGH
jgi:hypothetical protein